MLVGKTRPCCGFQLVIVLKSEPVTGVPCSFADGQSARLGFLCPTLIVLNGNTFLRNEVHSLDPCPAYKLVNVMPQMVKVINKNVLYRQNFSDALLGPCVEVWEFCFELKMHVLT